MVYGFIKQSGGHIKLDSEEGRGTTISLYLPPARDEDAPSLEDLSRSSWCGGSESILIVEDDTLVRYSVCAQLDSLGYRTHVAANADEAMAIIDAGTPIDLLFTDVIMPGEMDGRRLAEVVLARRPGIKVLFTSGYSEDIFTQDAHLPPGVRLLPKPYRKMELSRMLRETLDADGETPHDEDLAATAA
jgi:CheY-like chemotaxis protein